MVAAKSPWEHQKGSGAVRLGFKAVSPWSTEGKAHQGEEWGALEGHSTIHPCVITALLSYLAVGRQGAHTRVRNPAVKQANSPHARAVLSQTQQPLCQQLPAGIPDTCNGDPCNHRGWMLEVLHSLPLLSRPHVLTSLSPHLTGSLAQVATHRASQSRPLSPASEKENSPRFTRQAKQNKNSSRNHCW